MQQRRLLKHTGMLDLVKLHDLPITHYLLVTTQPDFSVSLEACQSSKGLMSDIPRELNFIGRSSTIGLVSQALADPSLGHRACLFGLGGVGLVFLLN